MTVWLGVLSTGSGMIPAELVSHSEKIPCQDPWDGPVDWIFIFWKRIALTIGCWFSFSLFLVLLLSRVIISFYTFDCRDSCLAGIQNFKFWVAAWIR